MNKSDLRRLYLSKQKAITRDERSELSRLIADRFFSTVDLETVRYLHCFLPIEKFNEIDTRVIFTSLWRDHPQIRTVVPRVDFETNEIISLKFGTDTALVRNVWDIEEPTHDEVIDPRMIDLVLVPGLCFDRHGHRVGYGKGFYDRFLKSCRPDCLKVGLGYFERVNKIDDIYEGDVTLNAVVTPDDVIPAGLGGIPRI